LKLRPIEEYDPSFGEVVLIVQGRPYAPCIYQEGEVISEEPFWLWWQADFGGFMAELKNPTHFIQIETVA
jgi:hypothetical protein